MWPLSEKLANRASYRMGMLQNCEKQERTHRWVVKYDQGSSVVRKRFVVGFFWGILLPIACAFQASGCVVASPSAAESVDTGSDIYGDTITGYDSEWFTSDSNGSDTETNSEPDLETDSISGKDTDLDAGSDRDTDTNTGSEPESDSDECPLDDDKTEPGICGCGLADEDGDGDGTMDCDDLCPEDPAKTDPGWCGCHVPEDGCSLFTNLGDAQGKPTGVASFKLGGGKLTLYLDRDYDGGGWILIGRGREDWAWSEGGMGGENTLYLGLGTQAAFPPAYLSAATIQELLDNTGVDLKDVQIRIRRAAATDGSSYQETLWRSVESRGWTWLFDAANYSISYNVKDSILGTGISTTGKTYDVNPSQGDHLRTFTYPWTGHNNKSGFSYGSTIQVGTNDESNFLWQYGTEGHSIPYSEVYIRLAPSIPKSCLEILNLNPSASDGTYTIDPDGDGAGAEFEVVCDMSGGGWTVMESEDFSSGTASGWEKGDGTPAPVDTTSTCSSALSQMLGGFGNFGIGDEATKTFDLLGIAHTEVAVTLDYIVLDSWDGETAQVLVDGVERYSTAFDHRNYTGNICGGSWADVGVQAVNIQAEHTGTTVTIRITSTLNQGASDESFGADNITVKIR